ncbi:Hint domain-containing protein [Acidiphilium iwatense]|uniref:Hint domain-containing protein n=1 Tax=Acidiphilium iwatense TaxID=768198 RepID=A0ABS9DV03_9PROT|nr:Hint domain-containing protein [Acidiphilium iwatense]MCF3945610.1 Hint domain-containing protein [Acidiphilium iwatense]
MSGSTITPGGTVTLTTSLSGNITFTNQGTDSGVLLIEPGALHYGPSTTNVVATYLGGNIDNFAPGDTIILANLEQDYANFDKAPSSVQNNATFDADIASLTSAGVIVYVEPGNTITTNNPLFNSLFGATLQSLAGPYLESIDEALFGVKSLNATLTITPTFEAGSTTVVDAVITASGTINPPCFAAGTNIATPRGEIPVEHLAAGDIVRTASGAEKKIVWIGHRSLDFRRHPNPERARPIRIAAGALADGVPARDLLVSPDHALFLDGALVQAKDIADGVLIAQEHDCARVTYYHVELDRHDILLAEGAAAESFLDTGHRGLFENSAEPVTLHPDLMQIVREIQGCAPLITGGTALAPIRARLAARKAELGYALVETTPWLRADSIILAPAERRTGTLRFTLPRPVRRVELVTGSFVPAETDPASSDHRRLGIALTAIVLDGKSIPIERAIAPAQRHPRAAHDAAVWTRGDAWITLPRAGRELVLTYAAIASHWRRDERVAGRQRRQR